MIRAVLLFAGLACLVIAPAAASAQRCSDERYRWTQKIDTTLRLLAPNDVEISTILSRWGVPMIGGSKAFRCAARVGREGSVYRVTGWLRRIEQKKDDGDWHLELTERRDSNVDRCIVAEIPLPELHPDFRQARKDLDDLLRSARIDKQGDLSKPVRIVVTGAAFYDGQHLGGNRRLVARDHGRCNSSERALWEIHPVYRVARP